MDRVAPQDVPSVPAHTAVQLLSSPVTRSDTLTSISVTKPAASGGMACSQIVTRVGKTGVAKLR
eukprot:6358891-Prymnesium_polylepis.2